MITKGAKNANSFRRKFFVYDRARDAFKALIQGLEFSSDEAIALPAYIGWSPLEGSGVFDPVTETNTKYVFYKIKSNLEIDIDDYKRVISQHKIKLSLIVHYFGLIDENYCRFVDASKERKIFVLEDEAHALYSDLISGVCGRRGDAALFSFHKMLPLEKGGAIVFNNKELNLSHTSTTLPITDYDLWRISKKRIANYQYLNDHMLSFNDRIVKLRSSLKEGEVPQSFPVLIYGVPRFELYKLLNERGCGVTSLYHTMIEPLKDCADAQYLSERILNLPIHQDVNFTDLDTLIVSIGECIAELEKLWLKAK